MSDKEARIWEVIHECNEHVSEKPLFPDNSDRSIRFAIEFFQSDELPEKAVASSLKHDYNNVSGYLWATNKRVLFVGSQSILSKKPLYREFTYKSISTILYEKKFLSGKIVLHVSTTAAKGSIASVEFESSGEQAEAFVNYVRNRIDNLGSSESIQQVRVDFMAELERLAALKNQGLISDDEFAAAKRKLLGL